MCTASWSVRSDGVTLCFNRDERKTRPRASPPESLRVEGVQCLAPIDPVGGGSWICVNEYGLCCFLLNNYAASVGVAAEGVAPVSRGKLTLAAAAQGEGQAAVNWFRRQQLRAYQPFHLGLICAGCSELFTWDGVRLWELQGDQRFFTTSSYQSNDVETYRCDRFANLVIGQEPLTDDQRRSYHLDLSHQDAAFNPFMRRTDAETHCLSSVVVTPQGARFTYEEVDAKSGKLLPPIVSSLSLR